MSGPASPHRPPQVEKAGDAMKQVTGAAVAVLLSAGLAAAQQPSPSAQDATPRGQYPSAEKDKPKDQSAQQSKDKNEFAADVVSIDASAKTITVKKTDSTSATGSEQMTLSVEPAAAEALSKVSAGDRVKLVCKTDTSGTQKVTKISRVETRPATDQPPNP